MLPYVGFIWNTRDVATHERANRLLERFRGCSQGWSAGVNEDGIVVFHKDADRGSVEDTYLLHDEQGLLIGRLFERSYLQTEIPAKVTFNEKRSAAVIESGGRNLIDQYWGRYVGFFVDRAQKRSWVLRDSTGAIPCYYIQSGGVYIYFLRVEDITSLEACTFSINFDYLKSRLTFGSSSSRDTGLNEMSKVLAGECVEDSHGKRKQTFYWNPLSIASAEPLEDATEAVRLMRHTVRSCVHAWASVFEGLLVALSGGVDSSILLAALSDAPTAPRITCFNNFSRGSNSDERRFARLASQKSGVRLIEREQKPDFTFDAITGRLPRAPEPFLWWSSLEGGQRDAALAHEVGASAIFTGHAGDEIFFRGGPLPTAVDFAYRHGLRSKLLQVAFDDAMAEDVSLWRILNSTLRYGLLKLPWNVRGAYKDAERPLVSAAVKAEAWHHDNFLHPLYADQLPRLEPGKIDHASLMSFHAEQNIYNPCVPESHPPEIFPLVSQPLVELSLRIPLYVLRRGGVDRAIARKSFECDLPRQITRRKTKGGSEELMKTLCIDRNLRIMRELLLDGILVRERLLVRDDLERVLSSAPTLIQSPTVQLLDYLLIETWLRSWQGTRQSFLRPDTRRLQ